MRAATDLQQQQQIAPSGSGTQTAGLSSINEKGLMVDTGATSHIVTDIAEFKSFDNTFKPETHCVELADGTLCRGVAQRKGNAEVFLVDSTGRRCRATLRGALFIPSYPRDIFSRCDLDLLDPHGDSEQPDSAEAARMVVYLTVRKGGARGRWKALKVKSRSEVEETETLLRSLQDRVQQIHNRRHTLTQLVQQLHSKKQQCEQLEESLLKAQNALQSCDHQLTQLRAESEAVLCQLISWQQLRDELQVYVSAAQGVMQINLLSFNQSQLCVELRPRLSSDLSSNELEPLKLSVTWSRDDRFRLQVSEGTAGLAEDCLSGRRAELSAALLEVMQCYVGQSELLSEIQTLRSSFAIDWRPAQRLLIYLKSALLVCHLEVEEGYPSSGRARLLSVRRDGQHVDTSGLKVTPHEHKPLRKVQKSVQGLCPVTWRFTVGVSSTETLDTTTTTTTTTTILKRCHSIMKVH
ncbi:uncharacterized protein LOC111646346 [Seriola lalandi dorsalis]|uniref:uncharacterized protein LOC111646346 n=1 Tax=Seriola lalandi dorsalis TaxID=1841481 RepID=UPI000C6F7683|nr:uncharacterized protein LOC111646346 [Seriola lalandi dorsalis]